MGREPRGSDDAGIVRGRHAAGPAAPLRKPGEVGLYAGARGEPAHNDRALARPTTGDEARRTAEDVAIMPARVVQRDAAVERLAEIVTMRRQLCDEHVAVENQAAHLEDAMLRRLSKRRQMRLEADIRLLDKRLAEMV